MVHEAAEIINSCSAVDKDAFSDIWSDFKRARQVHAGIMAQEALQSLEHYVTNRWAERKIASFDQPDVAEELWSTSDAAIQAMTIASRLGGHYLDRLARLQSVEQAVQDSAKKSASEEAISSSGVVFMRSKENALVALKRELEVLGLELGVLERPIQSLIWNAVLLKNDCTQGLEMAKKAKQELEELDEPTLPNDEKNLGSRQKKELKELDKYISELNESHSQLLKVEKSLGSMVPAGTEKNSLSKALASIIKTAAAVAARRAVGNTPIVHGLVFTQQMEHALRFLRKLIDKKKETERLRINEGPNVDPTREMQHAVASEQTTKGKDADMTTQAVSAEQGLKEAADAVKAAVPEDMANLMAKEKSPMQMMEGIEAVESTSKGLNRPLHEVLAVLGKYKPSKAMSGKVMRQKTPIRVKFEDIQMRMDVPRHT
ncbi:hypothetical protein XA68_13498 [Ophiocordyceps unilateralis]|uniref:Uncharacterized protein n=1 Tax=Ophiocordyceps unilateralis TaxID=268505 RepID=A0A2A9PCD5_OPHUN|nr:hypothetical protein XA68_13498 [Ophiocordyceps unilateralis]